MSTKARLIIPLWGEAYAKKLVSITLPALLAPGNLPAFKSMFEVELVLVTETRLFDAIRAAKSFEHASKLCPVRFVPIDDLLTELPGDYGVVLTYALYRGFTDLGARMLDTYLLFLNADFIISDGSLRHLGLLMQRGERVIHAPSFRVVLEDVWPELEKRVDPETSALVLAPRETARLALDHKHLTVRARTVNQRLCSQRWTDQFYWYVDDDTLIGYQWPVALVAIKPERVTLEPVLVWDYGFIPEAAPTAKRHFIGDSDDFFMLEPQKRTTGEELVRIGRIGVNEIARDLSVWTTREQRECGRELFKIHAGELPAALEGAVAMSRVYMADVYERLDPKPQPHIGHGWLGIWFEEAKERMRGRIGRPPTPPSDDAALPPSPASKPVRGIALRVLQAIYRVTFGQPPAVGRAHPLWLDLSAVVGKVTAWRNSSLSILWLTSRDSLFQSLLQNRSDLAALSVQFGDAGDRYDACLCELTMGEFSKLRELYPKIRARVKDGGEILVHVVNKNPRRIDFYDEGLCETSLPDFDISEIRFYGSRTSALLRRLFMRASGSFPNRPFARGLLTGIVLVVLAPLSFIANAGFALRRPERGGRVWTSVVMTFQVSKPPRLSQASLPARAHT